MIPKIESNRRPWDEKSPWCEESFLGYFRERIDPSDRDLYESSLGQIETIERSIERIQEFCGKMTELLLERDLIEFADVFGMLPPSGTYRFDGKEIG